MQKPSSFKLVLILTVAITGLLMGGMLAHGSRGSAAASLAACTPTGTTYGTVTFSAADTPPNPVVIPATGAGDTYNIWVRAEVSAVSSTSPLLLNLNNATGTNCYAVPGSAFPTAYTSTTPAWVWVNVTSGLTPPTLAAGNQTLVVTGTHSGVKVDNVEFLNDSTCVPTGTGGNCTTTTNTAPTVSVTAPTSGGTVSGTTTLSATAAATTTGATITSVQFQVDGTNVGTADTTAPYSYSWNTSSVSNGTHTITAIATDSNGLKTTSSSVTVTVKNGDTTPPTVNLTNPTNNQTVKGTVAVTATASDNVGVTKVQFYVDGVLASSVTASPYSYTWDTTKVANGSHILRAAAYDAAGNVGNSQINVTVQNADTQPPSKPTGVTATAKSATQVGLSWTASTDNVGVTGYYILRSVASGGFTTLGQVNGSTTTYTDTTVTANTTYSYEIEAFDAAGNVSPVSVAAKVTTPSPSDTTPPTQPTKLTATAISASQINLSWTASTDNVGVADYIIYRNGTQLTTVTTTSFGDTGLNASTTYGYYVVAVDASGNKSLASATASATTPAQSQTATIAGGVTGADRDQTIADVWVEAYVSGSSQEETVLTNSAGKYVLANLTPNENYITIFNPYNQGGYLSQHDTILTSPGTTTFNASLKPQG